MVIDTNVIVYALVGEPQRGEEAWRVLQSAPEIWVPDSIRAELANVIWQWIRVKEMPLEEGLAALNDAEALFSFIITTDQLWEDALCLAMEHEQAAYDTIFVALAIRRGWKVVTYDKKLLKKFPECTTHPSDYLAAST